MGYRDARCLVFAAMLSLLAGAAAQNGPLPPPILEDFQVEGFPSSPPPPAAALSLPTSGKPGQVLVINKYGNAVWSDVLPPSGAQGQLLSLNKYGPVWSDPVLPDQLKVQPGRSVFNRTLIPDKEGKINQLRVERLTIGTGTGMTLPNRPGTPGQVLKVNGWGQLRWHTPGKAPPPPPMGWTAPAGTVLKQAPEINLSRFKYQVDQSGQVCFSGSIRISNSNTAAVTGNMVLFQMPQPFTPHFTQTFAALWVGLDDMISGLFEIGTDGRVVYKGRTVTAVTYDAPYGNRSNQGLWPVSGYCYPSGPVRKVTKGAQQGSTTASGGGGMEVMGNKAEAGNPPPETPRSPPCPP